MTSRLWATMLCCAAFAAAETPVPARSAEVLAATANDNTTRAGTLHNGVLTVALYGTVARWYPGPDSAPPVVTQLFGEEGHAPSNPGPLLRMPLGTRVDLSIRNALPDTMFFAAACGFPCKKSDTLRIAPNATGHLRFIPRHPGTFVYWAAPIRAGKLLAGDDDGSQFNGVIVVDSGKPTADRIITVSTYAHQRDSTDASKGLRLLFAFNGKAWPFTERYTYTAGDTVHWRVVHLGGGAHPLHLHGFYFRVTARGDGASYHEIPRAKQPLAVTEQIGTLGTYEMTWAPDRPGNWLFHCHRPVHVATERTDDLFDRPHEDHAMSMENHALSGMGGLVIGIIVLPPRGAVAAGSPLARDVNRLRLLVKKKEDAYGQKETFGYAVQHADSAKPTPVSAPGPVLAVTRGQRTEITVVNQIAEPTSVHWHGIELESFYDGVAGWSGAGSRIAPLIAPGDSFTAVFTPPRAGTFMYHAHANDIRQIAAGLYGPLIVLEPGQTWNAETDHVFGIGQGGSDPGWVVVNGAPAGEPIRLKAGVKHRLRFYSLTLDDEADVIIEGDRGTETWTPVAKDGTSVPAADRTARPARLHIEPGETFDFEVTPKPGTYRLRVMSYSNILLTLIAR